MEKSYLAFKFIAAALTLGVVLLAVAVLSGCTTTQSSLAATDTCATNAAVVSSLADFKAQGKLSSAQISAVNSDILLIDPSCSAASPQTALLGAAATAATELATILTQVK